MTNTEAKVLYFAQYLGQKVFILSEKQHNKPLTLRCKLIDSYENGYNSGMYLLLRTVEQLKDEEKKILIDCCGWDINYNIFLIDYWEVKITSHNILILVNDENDVFEINNIGCDYLRSIGIVLPFTYLDENKTPTILSIEQIIKLGWAKLM